MAVRTWRVFGANGHKQQESFEPSYKYDFFCAKMGANKYIYHRGLDSYKP